MTPDRTDHPQALATIRGATTVVGDFGAIVTGKVATAVLMLVSVALTTRMLGAEGYGLVATVSVAASLIFIVTTGWTNLSVLRYGREELELRGNMSRLTWNRALIGVPILAVSVALILLLKIVNAVSGSLTWQLVGLVLGSGLARIIIDHWDGLLQASGKIKMSAAREVLSQLLSFCALAALFVSGAGASPQLVIALSIASLLFVAVLTMPLVWRVGIKPVAGDRKLLRRMLWLSVPLIGLLLGQYVLSTIDIVVLRMFRSQADVGIYYVAYQSFSQLAALGVAVTSVFVPLFVSLQHGGRSPVIVWYLERAIPQVMFLLSVLGGVGVAILPLVFGRVFGQAFASAAAPLAILSIGLMFLYAAYFVVPILTLHERTGATAAIWGIAAAINTGGDFIMVGLLQMGIIAPAIATSAALAFVFLGFYARARKVLDTASRPNTAVFAPFVAGLAPALIVGGATGAALGVGAVVGTALAIVAWRSPFSPEDVELIDKIDVPDGVAKVARKAVSLAS